MLSYEQNDGISISFNPVLEKITNKKFLNNFADVIDSCKSRASELEDVKSTLNIISALVDNIDSKDALLKNMFNGAVIKVKADSKELKDFLIELSGKSKVNLFSRPKFKDIEVKPGIFQTDSHTFSISNDFFNNIEFKYVSSEANSAELHIQMKNRKLTAVKISEMNNYSITNFAKTLWNLIMKFFISIEEILTNKKISQFGESNFTERNPSVFNYVKKTGVEKALSIETENIPNFKKKEREFKANPFCRIGYLNLNLSTAIVPLAAFAFVMPNNHNYELVFNFALLCLGANLIQGYSNYRNDSNSSFLKFLNNLSTKIVYLSTLNCIEPIVKEFLKDYCNPTLLSALSYVGTRIIYSNFNYEKNVYNYSFDSSRFENTFKSAVPAILSKVSEIFVSKNEGVKCFVYSSGKACIDTLVQNHFKIEEFWRNISNKNLFKFSFYGLEYFAVKTCDWFSGGYFVGDNIVVRTISSSIYRVLYETKIESFSKEAAEKLITIKDRIDSLCDLQYDNIFQR